ncbi:MAG TPA: hypothetical protein GXX28_07800 [Firmicutes bacterium]|nr:hypothetical protein [Bacillota bacterium]
MTPLEEHLAVFTECILRVLEMERKRKEAESGVLVTEQTARESEAARVAG